VPEPVDTHLPLGREPGPQSLRAAVAVGGDDGGGTGVLLPVMAILFLACFIAIPLVVISVTEAQGVLYPVLGALAIVFIVAMWLLARRLRSGGTAQYEVLAEPLELRRGDEVEAELFVYEPNRLGRLEVGVVCVERYDRPARGGDADHDAREVAEDVAYERWLPARRTEEEQRFCFRIPPEGPYSHEGECLSLAWRVSARDADGGEGSQADDPIWVEP
jgi:hypothetical protein